MAMAAEPRRAELPLPGGREGATVRVRPLLCAWMIGPPGWFHREEGRLARLKAYGVRVPRDEWLDLPVPAFLVEHPGAGSILIDTGFHPSVAAQPTANLGRLAQFTFRDIEMTPDQAVSAQLRERGSSPASIKFVVMTHLHIDHASAISEFPGATFVVTDAEWDAATDDSRPWLHGYRRRQFDHAFDYRTIDFEAAGIDSYSSFGRTFDLFGDGSIRLAYTPGHSAGHMSVIARLKERDFVIGGDATYTAAQLAGTAPLPPRPFDAHNYRRSLQELRLFKRQYPDAIVTPGHDAEFYAGLNARYE